MITYKATGRVYVTLISNRFLCCLWSISIDWVGALLSWSHCRWIYNYLCNQCLSPLTLWVLTAFMATVCDKVWQWLAAGRWISPNRTDPHDIAEILLKVTLSTITPASSISPIDWAINSCRFEWPYWPICLFPHLKQQKWNQLCCYMKGVVTEEGATLTTTLSNCSVRGDHKVVLIHIDYNIVKL